MGVTDVMDMSLAAPGAGDGQGGLARYSPWGHTEGGTWRATELSPSPFLVTFRNGHYRALSRVPCAGRQVLISYPFYIQWSVNVNPELPIYPSPSCP